MIKDIEARSDSPNLYLAWVKYLQEITTYDPLTVDANRIWEELHRLSEHLFGERTEVWVSQQVSDDEGPGSYPSCQILTSHSQVGDLVDSDVPDDRIISLIRLHIKANFRINLASLLKILGHQDICPSFFDLLLGFRGSVSAPAEKGFSAWSMGGKQDQLRRQVISYQLRYMDTRHGGRAGTWSEQQIGVYQVLRSYKTVPGAIVLLHAHENCRVKKVVHGMEGGSIFPLAKYRPFAIHSLVFSSYLYNWRWYLDELAQDCRRLENLCMTMELSAVAKRLSFTDLRHIRNVESRLLTAISILEATSATLRELIETIEAYKVVNEPRGSFSEPHIERDQRVMEEMYRRCIGFILSATEVQRRNDKLIQLTTDSINLAKQTTAERISQTIQIVTIITLTFLPAQFVASFFGTNFVLFNEASGNISISREVWIFVLCAIGLSMATGLSWWLIRANLLHHRRRRHPGALLDSSNTETRSA